MFGWLRTVAINEAYRLSGLERRDTRLGAPLCAAGSVLGHQRVEDPRALLDLGLEARLALARVAELPPRQRRLFALQIAGLSYAEASAMTGIACGPSTASFAARMLASGVECRTARASRWWP